jgi:hypothetical protein
MTDEEKRIRSRFNYLALDKIAGCYLTALQPDEPLRLGPDFAMWSKHAFDEFEVFRTCIIDELSKLSLDDISTNFATDGTPLTQHWLAWQTGYKNELRVKCLNLSFWTAVPFKKEKALADFDYWAKAEFLSLDEALWLSFGLMPLSEFAKRVEQFPGRSTHLGPIEIYVISIRELFTRGLNPRTHLTAFRHNQILDWINRVQLEVHPGFRRMLELNISRQATVDAAPVPASPEVVTDAKFDAREKASLAKLLTAMAITEYGYNPDARRSPIPKEIQDIANRLGLEVSQDTIRHYLQMGARFLPEGWKPEA